QKLWDTVQDRLYKLRNGLNINGEKQSPSMYGSPIDPARLLLAAQNGGINPYDVSSLQAKIPVYRFRELAQHTEATINVVQNFGAQLYSALIQKDGEQLQILQATHQMNMLIFVNQVYQYQIEEAKTEIDILQTSLNTTQKQLAHYDNLITIGLLPIESSNITMQNATASLQEAAAVARGISIAGHLLPNIFGLADGGMDFGGALEAAATILNESAQVTQTKAQLMATMAEHQRRAEDWKFQKEQTSMSLAQIQKSIDAAQIRLQIAQQNQKQYELSVKQANELYNYLGSKFSNLDLYTWLAGQMASLYFTAYQLASSSLHQLQSAYQYELDRTDNFIPTNAWNSLRKGLLAGETLKLALLRMQDSYYTYNTRRREIEKIYSVKKLVEATDWSKFVGEQGGEVKFDIDRKLLVGKGSFSLLRIKSIKVSLPALLGPYETFDATLTQTANKADEKGTPIGVTNQEVSISRGIDDMGIFLEETNDGRYLPFEGTGAISSWSFKVEKAIAEKISDIIFTIKFTAK
ncbi:MAG: hypothetical protein ACKVTZ_05630, partial [Bacteroidia bacterium]